nr:MAG TPA: hypothetical protein [Caudoviricetes sp.]
MGNINKKKQQQAMVKREAQIRNLPTIYTFNFKDVPSEKYTEALNLLFSNPDFAEAVRNRNELVRAANRIPQNSPQMASLIRAIQEKDKKLAMNMYSLLVQVNLRSEVSYDFLNFSQLIRYYVDYSKPGMQEKVNQLNMNLDKVTFLTDTLESIVTNVKLLMKEIFDGNIEFNQFDSVLQVLKQMQGFFNFARTKNIDSKDNDLYREYADSINAYMDKRMQTYSVKHRKLHPQLPGFMQDQMIEALNLFFGENKMFNESFIAKTESGGCYIDGMKLIANLNEEQTAKLDKLVPRPKEGNSMQKYFLNITDALMLYYAQEKGIALKK